MFVLIDETVREDNPKELVIIEDAAVDSTVRVDISEVETFKVENCPTFVTTVEAFEEDTTKELTVVVVVYKLENVTVELINGTTIDDKRKVFARNVDEINPIVAVDAVRVEVVRELVFKVEIHNVVDV